MFVDTKVNQMKKVLIGFIAIGLLTFVGCSSHKPSQSEIEEGILNSFNVSEIILKDNSSLSVTEFEKISNRLTLFKNKEFNKELIYNWLNQVKNEITQSDLVNLANSHNKSLFVSLGNLLVLEDLVGEYEKLVIKYNINDKIENAPEKLKLSIVNQLQMSLDNALYQKKEMVDILKKQGVDLESLGDCTIDKIISSTRLPDVLLSKVKYEKHIKECYKLSKSEK